MHQTKYGTKSRVSLNFFYFKDHPHGGCLQATLLVVIHSFFLQSLAFHILWSVYQPVIILRKNPLYLAVYCLFLRRIFLKLEICFKKITFKWSHLSEKINPRGERIISWPFSQLKRRIHSFWSKLYCFSSMDSKVIRMYFYFYLLLMIKIHCVQLRM